jgi:hypothetical protein
MATAGVFELSYNYSQMESNIDENNFQRTISHTASVSWYFMVMSALELSYTKGEGTIKATAPGDDPVYYRMDIQLMGADLVFSFAQRDAVFQPYIKGGAIWVDKKLFRLESSIPDSEVLINQTDVTDPVPSYGAGFRILLSKHIAIRASYDSWRSGKRGDEEVWDRAIRSGVSFIF